MTHDEMIAVIQAHKEGKKIQRRYKDTTCQWHAVEEPSWDFQSYDYRAMPEPAVEVWANAYPDGGVICHPNREKAERFRDPNGRTIFLREVTEL